MPKKIIIAGAAKEDYVRKFEVVDGLPEALKAMFQGDESEDVEAEEFKVRYLGLDSLDRTGQGGQRIFDQSKAKNAVTIADKEPFISPQNQILTYKKAEGVTKFAERKKANREHDSDIFVLRVKPFDVFYTVQDLEQIQKEGFKVVILVEEYPEIKAQKASKESLFADYLHLCFQVASDVCFLRGEDFEKAKADLESFHTAPKEGEPRRALFKGDLKDSHNQLSGKVALFQAPKIDKFQKVTVLEDKAHKYQDGSFVKVKDVRARDDLDQIVRKIIELQGKLGIENSYLGNFTFWNCFDRNLEDFAAFPGFYQTTEGEVYENSLVRYEADKYEGDLKRVRQLQGQREYVKKYKETLGYFNEELEKAKQSKELLFTRKPASARRGSVSSNSSQQSLFADVFDEDAQPGEASTDEAAKPPFEKSKFFHAVESFLILTENNSVVLSCFKSWVEQKVYFIKMLATADEYFHQYQGQVDGKIRPEDADAHAKICYKYLKQAAELTVKPTVMQVAGQQASNLKEFYDERTAVLAANSQEAVRARKEAEARRRAEEEREREAAAAKAERERQEREERERLERERQEREEREERERLERERLEREKQEREKQVKLEELGKLLKSLTDNTGPVNERAEKIEGETTEAQALIAKITPQVDAEKEKQRLVIEAAQAAVRALKAKAQEEFAALQELQDAITQAQTVLGKDAQDYEQDLCTQINEALQAANAAIARLNTANQAALALEVNLKTAITTQELGVQTAQRIAEINTAEAKLKLAKEAIIPLSQAIETENGAAQGQIGLLKAQPPFNNEATEEQIAARKAAIEAAKQVKTRLEQALKKPDAAPEAGGKAPKQELDEAIQAAQTLTEYVRENPPIESITAALDALNAELALANQENATLAQRKTTAQASLEELDRLIQAQNQIVIQEEAAKAERERREEEERERLERERERLERERREEEERERLERERLERERLERERAEAEARRKAAEEEVRRLREAQARLGTLEVVQDIFTIKNYGQDTPNPTLQVSIVKRVEKQNPFVKPVSRGDYRFVQGIFDDGQEKQQIEQAMAGIVIKLREANGIENFEQLKSIIGHVQNQGGGSHYAKQSPVGWRFKELSEAQTNEFMQKFSADFQEMCFNCGIFDGKAVTGEKKLIGFRLCDLPDSVIKDLREVTETVAQERKDLSTQKQQTAQALLAGCVTREAGKNSYIAQGNLEQVKIR